jgi:hypothetical protein
MVKVGRNPVSYCTVLPDQFRAGRRRLRWPTGVERLFLGASSRLAEAAGRTARQVREAALERRSRNFLRGLVTLFAVATLVAGLLSRFAFNQQRIARENEQLAKAEAEGRATQQMLAESEALARATQQALAESEADARAEAESVALVEKEAAEEQTRLSTSRELAVMAINKLEADPEFSILLSLQALEKSHTREAEESLHRAIQASRVRMALTGHAGGANSVAFSPDGGTIATSGLTGGVTLWEAASGQKLYDLPEGAARVARYSLDGDDWLLAAMIARLSSAPAVQASISHRSQQGNPGSALQPGR